LLVRPYRRTSNGIFLWNPLQPDRYSFEPFSPSSLADWMNVHAPYPGAAFDPEQQTMHAADDTGTLPRRLLLPEGQSIAVGRFPWDAAGNSLVSVYAKAFGR
jgi:hypothetical protein